MAELKQPLSLPHSPLLMSFIAFVSAEDLVLLFVFFFTILAFNSFSWFPLIGFASAI